MIFNANLQHLVKHFPIFVELLHNFKLKITFNSQIHQFNNRLKSYKIRLFILSKFIKVYKNNFIFDV